jgi:hypothetical protein
MGVLMVPFPDVLLKVPYLPYLSTSRFVLDRVHRTSGRAEEGPGRFKPGTFWQAIKPPSVTLLDLWPAIREDI